MLLDIYPFFIPITDKKKRISILFTSPCMNFYFAKGDML